MHPWSFLAFYYLGISSLPLSSYWLTLAQQENHDSFEICFEWFFINNQVCCWSTSRPEMTFQRWHIIFQKKSNQSPKGKRSSLVPLPCWFVKWRHLGKQGFGPKGGPNPVEHGGNLHICISLRMSICTYPKAGSGLPIAGRGLRGGGVCKDVQIPPVFYRTLTPFGVEAQKRFSESHLNIQHYSLVQNSLKMGPKISPHFMS